MGAGNVKKVFAHWGDLPDTPFRMLSYMAVIVPDADEQKRFYGGRETLAYAIGRMVPARSKDPVVVREREIAFKAVTRTLAVLKRFGAITLVSAGVSGSNSEYALNLGERVPLSGSHRPPENGGHSEPQADELGPRSAGTIGPRSAAVWPPLSGGLAPAQRDPYEYEEEVGLNSGGESQSQTASHPPRATGADVIPIGDRRNRSREQGRAEIAAKGAAVRAAIEARFATKEAQ